MQGEQLKLDLDYLMMQQHLAAAHEGDDGYIALCQIAGDGDFNQRHYLYHDLLREVNNLKASNKNVYISVNSFHKPERRLENVRQIRALYADVDCHHLTVQQAAQAIEDTLKHLNLPEVKELIPAPSMIVKTGRGLQLYWLLEDLPKQAVPLWQLVQDAITDKLAEVIENINVTVDNVSDIARVLRLSGTINTKSNTIATLIIQSSTLYRLDGLIGAYFPELNNLDRPRKKNAPHDGQSAKIHHFYNLYSLHYARLLDIVMLQQLRNGDVESDPCRRRMVFLYRYWGCCYCQNPAKALEDALAFNAGFTMPLPEKTVIRETRSAEKAYKEWLSGETVLFNGQAYRKGYNYRNATLIRWLDITPEEQREMKTIIGKEEKYRRKNAARNKSRYGKDKDGLTAKQRQRMERDQQIFGMYEQGLSQREIGRRLSIDKRTVGRVLNRVGHF